MHIPSKEEIHTIINDHLATIDHDSNFIELGFFGGNFTGLPLQQQESLLKEVNVYLHSGQIDAIRLSTRPDYIREANLSLLKSYGVRTVELGAQSFDDGVLEIMGRGHTARDVVVASAMIKDYGFNLGLQMMTGLPGDSREKSLETAEKIIATGADNTRIYPLLVIRDTPLAEMFKRGEYLPMDLAEAVSLVKELYRLFEEHHVNIIRVGLHPSEGLLNGSNLLAGPFHPSFRELVLTELWRDVLMPLMHNEHPSPVIIHVPQREINYAAGYASSNKKMLQTVFRDVRFREDHSLTGRNYRVSYS